MSLTGVIKDITVSVFLSFELLALVEIGCLVTRTLKQPQWRGSGDKKPRSSAKRQH